MLLLAILSMLLPSGSKEKPRKLTEKEKRELEYMAWEMSEEYDND